MRAIVISMLSAGWLLPIGFAAHTYNDYLLQVLLPKIRGQVPLTSSPLDQFALMQFQFALAWLAAVIVGWSIAALKRSRQAKSLRT